MKTIILADENATIEAGKKIAAYLKAGDIVKITGPLGAGKTTLVRGIVAGFDGPIEEVHSPTFSLIHEYECPNVLINHCDFYRLENNSMLDEFGQLEVFNEEKIFLVEWPERIRLFELINRERLIDIDLQINAVGRSLSVPSSWSVFD